MEATVGGHSGPATPDSQGESTPVAVARSAAHDRRFEHLARSGYVTSGLLHVVLGSLVAIVASGGSAEADQSGALNAVAAQPLGTVVLWIASSACLLLALWHCGSAVFHQSSTLDRLRAGGSAAVFAVIGVVVLRYALGARQSSSDSTQSLSALLMQSVWGAALLIAIGVGVLAVAGYHVFKGATRRFLQDLGALPHSAVRRVVTFAGVVGYVSKGVVLTALGLLFIVATIQRDPEDSSGLDGAVQALRDQPAGPVILGVLAAGLVFYGIYQVVRARYDTMR
ncbi:DUF1206 domain-containing protein [Zhihengliuella flava]|uniref:DUF1206 domain-containing protein n=1 Tax=Zhihengliuella flava TaxID=1285193 RepID=A0A931GFT9_9MICC|nr:DUF1206 domain-containing protein [Zhihengliuella flava]MBG6085037.1 hypothetical protein [Zhihengliuella flava]